MPRLVNHSLTPERKREIQRYIERERDRRRGCAEKSALCTDCPGALEAWIDKCPDAKMSTNHACVATRMSSFTYTKHVYNILEIPHTTYNTYIVI